MAEHISKERRLFLRQKMAEAAKPDPMAATQWNEGVKSTPAPANSHIPLDRYVGIDTKVLFPQNVYMPSSTVQYALVRTDGVTTLGDSQNTPISAVFQPDSIARSNAAAAVSTATNALAVAQQAMKPDGSNQTAGFLTEAQYENIKNKPDNKTIIADKNNVWTAIGGGGGGTTGGLAAVSVDNSGDVNFGNTNGTSDNALKGTVPALSGLMKKDGSNAAWPSSKRNSIGFYGQDITKANVLLGNAQVAHSLADPNQTAGYNLMNANATNAAGISAYSTGGYGVAVVNFSGGINYRKTDDFIADNNIALKSDIPAVPSKVSQLSNDAGYITAKDVPPAPNVPTKTSQLTNDSGFITSSAIPSKVSSFQNDAGYQKASDVVASVNKALSGYTPPAPAIGRGLSKDANGAIQNNNYDAGLYANSGTHGFYNSDGKQIMTVSKDGNGNWNIIADVEQYPNWTAQIIPGNGTHTKEIFGGGNVYFWVSPTDGIQFLEMRFTSALIVFNYINQYIYAHAYNGSVVMNDTNKISWPSNNHHLTDDANLIGDYITGMSIS